MLILVPAGVLVLIVLAAIAVDMGVVYLGQRQLADATAAAANDGAGAGLSDPAFYRGGTLGLDEQRVGPIVCAAVRAGTTASISGVRVEIAVSGRSLAVRTRGRVAEVFGRAIPGVASTRPVQAEAEAKLATGPPTPDASFLIFHSLSC